MKELELWEVVIVGGTFNGKVLAIAIGKESDVKAYYDLVCDYCDFKLKKISYKIVTGEAVTELKRLELERDVLTKQLNNINKEIAKHK
jgi:hypothetical protein